MCKSLRGFIPSVPPNTNKLSPTAVLVWLSLGVGGEPFKAGWLHVCFTANQKRGIRKINNKIPAL